MTSNPLLLRRSGSAARRARLLACAAVVATALATQPARVDAQAFQGTIGGTSGAVTRTPTSGTTETITIGSPTAIIDWNPSCTGCPATFDFLPTANTATFEGASNFAVLNRIGGSSTIQFNGTVISQLQGSPGTRTGTILFQAPNGLIVGPTAVFNVGSLVLTSLEVATVGEGGAGPYFNPNSLSFSLGGSSGSALVNVQAGGQINAPAEGSFIALVAPRVDMAGSVTVNGSAAYIAADQVDVTVNAGLFDIVVATGSSDANGVIHTGSTTGPASTGGADNHGIYLVAIPKSQAMEAFLSGTTGFAPPVSPTIENGTLVLSAGYTVVAGQFSGTVPGAAPARFNLLGGTHTSDVRGIASENFIVNSASSALDFAGDVTVRGDNSVLLNALNNFDIDIAGNLVLDASDDRSSLTDGSDAFGGTATITVQAGSTVTVVGNARLDARATGANGVASLPGGDATGGTAFVGASGALDVGGLLTVEASAQGGSGATAGNGLGGLAEVFSDNGGDVTAGSAVVRAEGAGGSGTGSDGGDGTGGAVSISSNGAGSTITFETVDTSPAPNISASGNGGANQGGGSGVAGTGTGGDIYIGAQAGASIDLGNSTGGANRVWARGFGGRPVANGATGGLGEGGEIFFEAVGPGSSLSGGGLNISANGFGIQSGVQGANVTGGDAIGGITTIRANSGGVVTLNNSIARASGIGGFGTGTGNGGAGIGGTLNVEIDGGELVLEGTGPNGGVSFGASGGGGNGATGGDGFLGLVSIRVVNGGALTATDVSPTGEPNLLVFVQGAGGVGTVQGGTGSAGTIEFLVDPSSTGSTIDVVNLVLTANGLGGGVQPGFAGTGGNGIGGEVQLVMGNANDAWSFANLTVEALGIGGTSIDSAAGSVGGSGAGGIARVETAAGQLTVSDSLSINASGGPGNSFGAGGGESGAGGLAELVNNGATLVLGDADVSAEANGGTTGSAQGGISRLVSNAGQTTINGEFEADSDGEAGGGSGTGGTAAIVVDGGAVQIAGDVVLDAAGEGGSSAGLGGTALGGQARIDVAAGSLAITGGVELTASAEAGAGTTGGFALGGEATILATDGDVALGSLELIAFAIGGTGTGNGSGGIATVQSLGAGTVTINGAATLDGSGTGGAGTASFDGGVGTGGTARYIAETGGTITVGGLSTFNADGIGGAGLNGGNGFGGFAQVLALAENIDLANATLSGRGVGGNATGGTGGDGLGGVAQFYANNGGTIDFASASLSVDGVGGSGATGGSGTGSFNTNPPQQAPTGGTFVVAEGATIAGTSLTMSSNGTGGASTSGIGGAGAGGQAFVESWNAGAPSRVDIDNVTLSANATGGQGGAGSAGGAAIGGGVGAYAETISGNIQLGTLTASANALGGAGGAGGRGGDAQGGGALNIGSVSGPGSGTTAGTASYGTITATANATGGAGGANGAGGDGIGGSAGLLARGGTLGVTSASFTANGTGGAGSGAAGGAGTGGDIGALLTVRAGTTDAATVTIGTFTASSTGAGGAGTTAGQSLHGTANFDLIGSSATVGTLNLLVAGNEPGSAATDNSISVDNSTLTVTQALNIDVEGFLDFAAIGSGLIAAATLDSRSEGPTTITHQGRAPGAGTVIGNSLSFASGGEIVVEAGSVVAASAVVSFDSGEDLEIRGEIYAPEINLTSVDIEIDAGGVVGDEDDPGEVNIVVVPSGEQVELGDGLPGGDGYKLTQDEVERIEASSATVFVSRASNDPAREPDVLIGDLLIAGSLDNGPSSVTVETNGTIRVVGDLEYFGAAAEDTLLIRADERLEVITPEGSITVLEADDVLGGRLLLASNNLVVADAELAGQLEADPDFDGRAEALLANDGEIVEFGYVRALGIGLYSGGNIFVRNTGDATDFAGLLVGEGGLVIGSLAQLPGGGQSSGAELDVVAFGRRVDPDGTFTGGEEFFAEVDFSAEEGVAYTQASEFNTCAISTGCFVAPPPNTTNSTVLMATVEDPAAELVESADEEASLTFGTNFVGIVDTGSLAAELLIDQAVLSGGDNTAWDGTCPPDEPECEAEDGGPGE